MKKYEEILDILNKDPIENANMINFISNYKIEKAIVDGGCVLIIGKSDERWIYNSSTNKAQFMKFLERLDESDKYFVIQKDWMIDGLEEKFETEWVLSCEKYVIEDKIDLSIENRNVSKIRDVEAEYIYRNYDYSGYASVDYIKERIKNDIALGIRSDNKLIAWILIHDDGAIGMLHVLEEYRGKGYAELLMNSMIKELRKKKRIPFVHIEKSNKASKNLCEKLGFVKFSNIHWVKLK